MIKRTKEGFCICFDSKRPAEDYVETVDEFVKLLRDRSHELDDDGYFYAHELLRSMLPTYDQVNVMFEDIDDD